MLAIMYQVFTQWAIFNDFYDKMRFNRFFWGGATEPNKSQENNSQDFLCRDYNLNYFQNT